MRSRDYFFAFFLIALACVGAYFLLPAYRDYQATRAETRELQEENAELELQTQDVKSATHALQTDQRAVERVAREKFGWCREGEKIYHFEINEGDDAANVP